MSPILFGITTAPVAPDAWPYSACILTQEVRSLDGSVTHKSLLTDNNHDMHTHKDDLLRDALDLLLLLL
jgi:hypothetical protein